MNSQRILLTALALLAAFIVAAYPLTRDALSPAEARALWLVSDPPTSQRSETSLRTALSRARDSLVFAYNRTRSESEFVLYYPPLDVWQSLMGTSVFAARLPSMWCAMLALAITFALAKRAYSVRVAFGVLIFLAGIGFVLGYARQISPHSLVMLLLALVVVLLRWRKLRRRELLLVGFWGVCLCAAPLALPQYRPSAAPAVIAEAARVRQAGEPAITLLDPQSPFWYYSREAHLIQGISLDLSWQAFSVEQVRGYVDALANAPSLWLIMPEVNDLTAEAIVELVQRGYVMAYQAQADGILLYRFDR
ncbi:MAG: hypothetical protein U0694_22550 [Anaerolineae bacterium]